MKKTALLVLSLFFVAANAHSQTPTTFSYNNPSDCTTSAGIYDAPPPLGHLLRTLWSLNYTIAGPHTYTWDGKNDLGGVVTGSVYPRVACSQTQYTFDGPIGRTDNNWYTSSDTLAGYTYTQNNLKYAFPGNGSGYATTGYAEGVTNIYKFNPVSPSGAFPLSSRGQSAAAYANLSVDLTDIATDGVYLYVCNRSNSSYNWVSKFNLSGAPATFSGSTTTVTPPLGWSGSPINAIAYTVGNANPYPQAIAVQVSGNLLAVAYPTANVVNFYDKTSGAAVGTPVTITAPISLAFTSAGLWVVSQSNSSTPGVVTLVSSPSSGNTTSNPLSGLSNPQSIDSNQSNNNIVVLDGGVNQQAIEFNSAYTVIRTYGALGGYTGFSSSSLGANYGPFNPIITNDKLMVDQVATAGTYAPTLIPSSSVATGGSWIRMNGEELFICDGGDQNRVIAVSAANTYENQMVSGQDWGYDVNVGQNNPTRLFNYWVEYAINYNVPNNPGDPNQPGGNGSWTPKYNWAVGNLGANGSHALTRPNGFFSVEQFSNGLTYMVAFDTSNLPYEVYLPTSGPMVQIGALPTSPTHNYQYDTAGDLLYVVSGVLYKEALTGFTGNNPIRSTAAAVATFATNPYGNALNTSTYDPTWTSGWNQEYFLGTTTDGVYPLWNTNPIGQVATMTPAGPYVAGHNFSNSDTISVTPCGTHAQGTVTTDGNGHVASISLTSPGANCPNSGKITGVATTTTGNGVGLLVNYTNVPIPHLAGGTAVSTQYLFETNYEGFLAVPDQKGTFPVTGAFGGHNGQACGVSGRHIYCMYDGQYAAYGQTVYDYLEDGLAVGQFGIQVNHSPGGATFTLGNYGNIALWKVVTVNGDAYGYASNEAPVSPIVRWHMSNIGTCAVTLNCQGVYEYSGSGPVGSSIPLQ